MDRRRLPKLGFQAIRDSPPLWYQQTPTLHPESHPTSTTIPPLLDTNTPIQTLDRRILQKLGVQAIRDSPPLWYPQIPGPRILQSWKLCSD